VKYTQFQHDETALSKRLQQCSSNQINQTMSAPKDPNNPFPQQAQLCVPQPSYTYQLDASPLEPKHCIWRMRTLLPNHPQSP
jgi:hypothetical protein